MKKLFAIVLMMLLSVPAFSQIKFGITAGASTTTLSMSTFTTPFLGNSAYTVDALKSAKYGFQGGVFMRLSLLGIYIQPSLLLATSSNEYSVENLQTYESSIVKQSFNRLEVPIMVGLKLGPVRLNVGPAASLLLNSPKTLVSDTDYKSIYSKMTFGYQAGIGIDILKILTFDIKYEGSLKKYQNQIQGLASGTKFNLDDRSNAFILSVGVMF